jgi:hypothetical protein
MRGKESLPGAGEAVALVLLLLPEAVLWRCQAALRFQRQLQAVLLSPTAQRHSSRLFLRFLTFPRGFWLSFLSVLGFLVVISLFFSVFFFVFFSPLGFLSSFQSSFRVSLFSGFLSFFLLPFFSAFLGSIYRGQGRCFLQLSRGAAGWSAIGRGCRGSVGGARWVVGHCVRSVGSRREWPAKNQKKATFFPFFPAA